MESDDWLSPPDFIARAADAEAWDDKDWSQWDALESRLKEIGVTRLALHSPSLLIAHHPGPFAGAEIDERGTLNAVLDLVWKIAPPVVPFEAGERVVVNLRGFPKPDDAGDWEYGVVEGFDMGTEEVTVRLTDLASRPAVVVPYQNVRHVPRAERNPR
jgi:hypothetical protein